MIHPTAVVSPKATLGDAVIVGPYAVIDAGVELGDKCEVGPHVYLTGLLMAGHNNRFHAGCVIGDAPQDLKYKTGTTRIHIGDHNVFREHVTVHRAATPDGETVIGSHNFLMAHSHVGHNARVHNHVILANGALLAGHTEVFDRAFLSGNTAVHQFVRVGTLAMMQGLSAITQDLPPFTVAKEINYMCGLNIVGMRRAGIGAAERLELKRLYRFLFRSGRNLPVASAEARSQFQTNAAVTMLDFIDSARRGVVADYTGVNRADEE